MGDSRRRFIKSALPGFLMVTWPIRDVFSSGCRSNVLDQVVNRHRDSGRYSTSMFIHGVLGLWAVPGTMVHILGSIVPSWDLYTKTLALEQRHE